MLRVTIHSRRGNAVLGFLGVVYSITAVVLLVWHVRQTWGAAGMIDRVMQLMLIGTAVTGVWFVAIAAQNLGWRRHHSRAVRRHSDPATV